MRGLYAVLWTLLLLGISASPSFVQPGRAGESVDAKADCMLFPYFIVVNILDVSTSPDRVNPGDTVHVTVTVDAAWDVLDFSSYWVEALYDNRPIGRKSVYVLWSGKVTDTMDFTWNTSGVEIGSYLVSARTSTGSTYEAGYVYIAPPGVDIMVPDDYPTIQEAVNHAAEEETIFVRSGTYYENVAINKTVSLIGESREATAIDGFPITPELDYIVIFLKDATNVHLSGFTIRNGPRGIELDHSHNCTITNCRIVANYAGGLTLFDSNHNTVMKNVIESNEGAGIDLAWSDDNLLTQNRIRGNTYGIELQEAQRNTIYRNNLVDNLYEEARTQGSNSTWDNGCEGNYWGDYRTRYPNASFDIWGIGNPAYIIDENSQDRFPLMNVFWNPSDTDHDLDVDLFDLVKVCHFYGAAWQDECRHIDLAEPYGVINIFDIVTITTSYGERYAP